MKFEVPEESFARPHSTTRLKRFAFNATLCISSLVHLCARELIYFATVRTNCPTNPPTIVSTRRWRFGTPSPRLQPTFVVDTLRPTVNRWSSHPVFRHGIVFQ